MFSVNSLRWSDHDKLPWWDGITAFHWFIMFLMWSCTCGLHSLVVPHLQGSWVYVGFFWFDLLTNVTFGREATFWNLISVGFQGLHLHNTLMTLRTPRTKNEKLYNHNQTAMTSSQSTILSCVHLFSQLHCVQKDQQLQNVQYLNPLNDSVNESVTVVFVGKNPQQMRSF